jgi:hypothetical protein
MTISSVGGPTVPGRSDTTPPAPAPQQVTEPANERVGESSAAAPLTGQIVDRTV